MLEQKKMDPEPSWNGACPISIQDYPNVTLAHGGGGKLMKQLIEKMMLASFSNPKLEMRHDASVFHPQGCRVAMTTDSFVVSPLFFPGGDIGSLSVFGTVNDLAMSGAEPKYLSAAFILEEGFQMEALWRIVQSMKSAAVRAGVEIITGDTKVVDRGKADGVFINTAGVGFVRSGIDINPKIVRPGDHILINGDVGRHGMAIMALREGLAFESTIQSDLAPLNGCVTALLEKGIKVHCMRDLTRGGLASALNEISESAGCRVQIDEEFIPVTEQVQGACEILGLDPLYVANEGRFITILPADQSQEALHIMRAYYQSLPYKEKSLAPAKIGEIRASGDPVVILKNPIGTKRILDMISGEQLPRIC